ncbi:hypothetical protein CCR75_006761 [Bremia lactucae]|uniref:Uncharacterized protein n=1 Tax=Bremia lactucae TaxID=4779 RepID=A0A976FEQ6_BRELC|nr:hypothetical protein CCR75_006761 [Bremia lactucae]
MCPNTKGVGDTTTANTKHGACIHSASADTQSPMEPTTVHQKRARFQSDTTTTVPSRQLQGHPALTAVIARLQHRVGSHDGNHFRCPSHQHVSGNTDTLSRNTKSGSATE